LHFCRFDGADAADYAGKHICHPGLDPGSILS
jgi:hypothetical protein